MFPATELSLLVVGLLKDTGSGKRLKTPALEFSFPGLWTILYWYALRINAQRCSLAEARGGIALSSSNRCFKGLWSVKIVNW